MLSGGGRADLIGNGPRCLVPDEPAAVRRAESTREEPLSMAEGQKREGPGGTGEKSRRT